MNSTTGTGTRTYLLLSLNQRLQVFNYDHFKVLHSFPLEEKIHMNSIKPAIPKEANILPHSSSSHLKPADFLPDGFRYLLKVPFSLLDLPLQLKDKNMTGRWWNFAHSNPAAQMSGWCAKLWSSSWLPYNLDSRVRCVGSVRAIWSRYGNQGWKTTGVVDVEEQVWASKARKIQEKWRDLTIWVKPEFYLKTSSVTVFMLIHSFTFTNPFSLSAVYQLQQEPSSADLQFNRTHLTLRWSSSARVKVKVRETAWCYLVLILN